MAQEKPNQTKEKTKEEIKAEAVRLAREVIERYEKINRPTDAIFWGNIIDILVQ